MNLLEHYLNDYTVSKVTIADIPLIKYEGTVICYGMVDHVTRYFSLDEWEKVKKQGYYMD